MARATTTERSPITTEALRLNPRDATAYRFRGDAYRAKDDTYRFRGDAYRAKDHNDQPSDHGLQRGGPAQSQGCQRHYRSRGDAYRAKEDDHDRAIVDYTEGRFGSNPKDANAYRYRGYAYYAKEGQRPSGRRRFQRGAPARSQG